MKSQNDYNQNIQTFENWMFRLCSNKYNINFKITKNSRKEVKKIMKIQISNVFKFSWK